MKSPKLYFSLFFTILIILFSIAEVSAQRWKKSKPETIYARNKKKNTTPIYVGIGTKIPTAQLHVIGSVRFEGLAAGNNLNSVVAVDGSGNLFLKDISNSNNNSWLLNGNSVTSSNFFGTTNNEDIRIRTNNIQRAIINSAGMVGIGIGIPTAQLHTNGTVRFEGVTNNNALQRIALFDNNGNLFYRDLASLQSNFWGLTGNTGTNPASNFLGTTDNNRLVFRTNNTERMTILADGRVGFNTTTPATMVEISNNILDNHLRVSGVSPSIQFVASGLGPNDAGRIGHATTNNHFTNGSLAGDFIIQTLGATSNLIFGVGGGGTGNGFERMRINPNGFVGIATTNPTARLHTIGTVRHEGLANGSGNPLVVDVNGNVFVGNAGNTSNEWSLTGNAGTNPAINFLGTTDNNRLVFRTNNTERITILADGRVGFNTTTPVTRVEISNNILDNHLRVSGVSPSIQFVASGLGPNDAGRIGHATTNNHFTNGSLAGDFIIQTLGATSNLIFGVGGGGTGNGFERMRINPNGFVGIATQSPTAVLHTNGSVRFQNLPTGTGNIVVMDANGNLFRSSTIASREKNNVEDEISMLKKEIEELKSIVNSIKEGSLIVIGNDNGILYQNVPNPYKNSTTIRYYLPGNIRAAFIQISDVLGNVLKKYPVSNGKQQSITITGSEFTAGTYIYTLFADNKKVDSKKMILTK